METSGKRDAENAGDRTRRSVERRFETLPFILLYQIFRLEKIRICSVFSNFFHFREKNSSTSGPLREKRPIAADGELLRVGVERRLRRKTRLRSRGDSAKTVDDFLSNGVDVDLPNDFDVGTAPERAALVGVGNRGRPGVNRVDGIGFDRRKKVRGDQSEIRGEFLQTNDFGT